ncbi:hypothetical protein [Okeania sp.]|uniref:hypothetical protein n=1 Tax=Okeania sp. TaxID=3100323 RepID=UPI002B4B2B39|nr:hypothetical protein [Okeania sp.]MEB3342069.1 hypothetical protein [Okeania sp.]
MTIVICPGIHDPHLTDQFLEGLCINWPISSDSHNFLVYPTKDYASYSALDISNFLWYEKSITIDVPLLFIAFSAGVVGAIGAAWTWQMKGGQVKAVIAIDGWGMPLTGNFPIYKLSHDYFTHWSWGLLGSSDGNFYAHPFVEHLEIWRSPQTTRGWWLNQNSVEDETAIQITAAEFIRQILETHGELIQ